MNTPDYTPLIENGLNLIAIFDTATLPDAIAATIPAHQLARHTRLMLVGNGGGDKLWAAMQRQDMAQPDPIDHFSIETVRAFITNRLDNAAHHLLYPLTDYLVPLQQLGALAGWHHDSPLGLGIHSRYGVWFAYRAAFLIDAPLPLRAEAQTPSPCDRCQKKPCITHCPVQAVRGVGQFQVSTCGQHRIAPQSPCVDRCLSRLACPVGREHRYPLAQIQYHYTHSLPSMREWYARSINNHE